MDIDSASAGLADIMQQTGADKWSQSPDGYVIKFKKHKHKGYERRLVPVQDVEARDRSIEDGVWPSRVSKDEFVRLEDSEN